MCERLRTNSNEISKEPSDRLLTARFRSRFALIFFHTTIFLFGCDQKTTTADNRELINPTIEIIF